MNPHTTPGGFNGLGEQYLNNGQGEQYFNGLPVHNTLMSHEDVSA